MRIVGLIGGLCLAGMALSIGIGRLAPYPINIAAADIAWSAD